MVRAVDASPASTSEAKQQAAALEIVRREALRTGRQLRAVLSFVRLSDPPTATEQLVLAAIRLLRSPHVILPAKCTTIDEWRERYARFPSN
jgi:hypothetical protein